MADMDGPFAEMIETLREAKQAVDSELREIEGARFLDRDRLARVEESARGFEEQVNSLAEMMTNQGATQELLEEVEDLFDFFRQIEERAEAIIEKGQR